MTTTIGKLEGVTLAPRRPSSTILLGEASVLGPKSEFEIGLRDEDPMHARRVHLEQVAAEAGADDLMNSAAEAAIRRAQDHNDSSLAWSQAGFACLASGQFDKARDCFVRALAIEPLRNAQLGMARVWLSMGEHDKAEALLTALSQQSNDDPEVLMSLSVVIADRGDTEGALRVLDESAITEPSASFFAARGSLRLSLGYYASAVSDLRKAIKERPDWTHVRNVLGLAEFKLGRFSAAERHFREASRIAPLYLEPFLNLLRVMGAQSRFVEIAAEVTRLYSPPSAPATVARIAGTALLELGEWREATYWLASAAEKTTDPIARARVLNNLGCSYSRLENQALAGEFFEESLKTSATELAFINRAKSFLLAGHPLLAVNWLGQPPLALAEPTYERMSLLARALSSARMTQQAIKVSRELVEAGSADVSMYALLSALLVDEAADPAEAVVVAEQGLAAFPGDATLVNNLAYALLMANRVEEAEAVLSSEMNETTAADRVVLTATRGLLALKTGDIATGNRLYEEALQNAEGEVFRARLRAKRDLELGRALMRSGIVEEASKLFTRAAGEQKGSPYQLHAEKELKRLGK